MFWGWMIDPGKKGLTRFPFTTPTNKLSTQAQVKRSFPLQEEMADLDHERQRYDYTMLLQHGFALEEAHNLCKLQQWYQNGGSDRALVLYHLEFLRRLVANGSLER